MGYFVFRVEIDPVLRRFSKLYMDGDGPAADLAILDIGMFALGGIDNQ